MGYRVISDLNPAPPNQADVSKAEASSFGLK
jgi:hypothetical protein